MAVFNSAVLTTRGNELLVDAVAGDRITFTRMVVGCGEYSDRERERSALERMTSLKDIKQEFTFSAYKKVSEQCVLLTAVISNRELDYSYKITEIGIYGKRTEDEADFLCSIAVTKSLEESDTFPPYNGLQECQIVQDYYITISPDAEVSVNTQGACVLREEFELIKQTLSTEISGLKEGKLDKDGDGSNLNVTFEQAKDRKNISSGSKLSVIMGIISKVIADLKTGAFSVVVNHLMATEEGGVLDSRQGKALKDMIDELKRSLDSLTQSFRDGCKMIVDRLTALGYGPAAPQGPEQIVAAISIMYDDRYNAGYGDGRIQGQADVIANPGAYGISTGFYWMPCESTKKDVSRQVLLSAGMHRVYVVGQHFGNYESYCIIRNSAGSTLWEWHSTGDDQHIHTGYGEFNFSVAETVTVCTVDSSSVDMFFTSITIL